MMSVRYHELRPAQLKRRREALPVAYLPLGTLEWHGLHNPLGLDGIKAEELSAFIAREVGGIVMPTLYWGDHRGVLAELVFDPSVSDWLPEGTVDHTGEIESCSGVPKELLRKNAERMEREGGWRLFRENVRNALFEVESLGFERVVVVPGHYPEHGPASEAIEAYTRNGGALRTLVLPDSRYDESGTAGDHAAAFETSMMLALRPELVDLEALPSDGEVWGVLGDDPRVHASAEFGWRIVNRLCDVARAFCEGESSDDEDT